MISCLLATYFLVFMSILLYSLQYQSLTLGTHSCIPGLICLLEVFWRAKR